MIVKEWLCNLSKIFFSMRSMPFFTNYSKGGTHVITPKGKSSHANLKCA